jgi:peptide/nickel transport system permease protein
MPSDATLPRLAGFRFRPRFSRIPASSAIGFLLVGIIVLATLFSPWLTSFDPLALGTDILVPPDAFHPLGTDDLGRDLLARILRGGRVTLGIGLFSAVIGVVLGVGIGLTAGFFGGAVDEALMRMTEVFLVLPKLLVAVVVVSLLGSSIFNEVMVIGLLSWMATARIIRTRVQVIRQEEFIAAAAMSGASRTRILLRHILPNVLPYLLASATLQVASAIMSESFLSFLGLGDPNHPSWGFLLQQGQLYIDQAWWLTTFPGIALAMTIVGCNLIGDGLGESRAIGGARR